MKVLLAALLIVACYAVLLVQFFKAHQKRQDSTADVVLKGGDLAVLNQRHRISLMAMVATTLYVTFAKEAWLLLHPIQQLSAVLLTLAGGTAALVVSMRAARQVLRKRIPSATFTGSAEKYLLLRGLFLIFYEIFFRAILLQACLAWVSVPVAIAINVVLYAGAHAFSTRQELLGTVPFGILLCGITLFSGSVFPAILLHLLLGLPYDLLILSAPKRITKTAIL